MRLPAPCGASAWPLALLSTPPPRRVTACADPSSSSSSRAIGDVVQGLHGGKYQFEAGGGDRAAGMAFAEALAGGGAPPPMQRAEVATDLPRWMQRLAPEPLAEQTLVLAPGTKGTVTVVNRFTTWEPYFAVLFPADAPWEVEPSQGTLAPRGGANNACDPSQPYADRHTLEVRCQGGEAGDEAKLLVATEEEHWTYALQVAAGP